MDWREKNLAPTCVGYWVGWLIFVWGNFKHKIGHFQSSFLGKLQGFVDDKLYFSFPTIKEDSKKQKTLKVFAVVLKKS
jgi:hypothetical protein